MADQSTGYTPTPFDLAGGSGLVDYQSQAYKDLLASLGYGLQAGQVGGYTPQVEPLGPQGQQRDWYNEVAGPIRAYVAAHPDYKRDPNNPSQMDPALFASIAQAATGAGNADIWGYVQKTMNSVLGTVSNEDFAKQFNAVMGNAFTAATPSLAKQQMDQTAAQYQQTFGENQRQYNTTAGQNYMNMLSNLSGPSNYFQYANALRGAEGSPQLAFAQKLASGGLAGFQWGQSPGAMTPQSLLGQPPAGGGVGGPTPAQPSGVGTGTGAGGQLPVPGGPPTGSSQPGMVGILGGSSPYQPQQSQGQGQGMYPGTTMVSRESYNPATDTRSPLSEQDLLNRRNLEGRFAYDSAASQGRTPASGYQPLTLDQYRAETARLSQNPGQVLQPGSTVGQSASYLQGGNMGANPSQGQGQGQGQGLYPGTTVGTTSVQSQALSQPQQGNAYSNQQTPQLPAPQTWNAMSINNLTPTETGLMNSALKSGGYNPEDAWATYNKAAPKGQASGTSRWT